MSASAHEIMSQAPIYTAAERRFVAAMMQAADDGVGFGWMQQVAEWEWRHRSAHGAWGPHYFESELAKLRAEIERLQEGSGG